MIAMERRLFVGTYFVLFVFAVMVLKLFSLQIVRGDEYKQISDSNRLKVVKLPAPRGIIYDRNGRAFVRNIRWIKEDSAPKAMSVPTSFRRSNTLAYM